MYNVNAADYTIEVIKSFGYSQNSIHAYLSWKAKPNISPLDK